MIKAKDLEKSQGHDFRAKNVYLPCYVSAIKSFFKVSNHFTHKTLEVRTRS